MYRSAVAADEGTKLQLAIIRSLFDTVSASTIAGASLCILKRSRKALAFTPGSHQCQVCNWLKWTCRKGEESICSYLPLKGDGQRQFAAAGWECSCAYVCQGIGYGHVSRNPSFQMILEFEENVDGKDFSKNPG